MPAANSNAGAAALSPGSNKDARGEGGEQRMEGTAPGGAREGAATKSQACSGRKSVEHALLAVQEQLARVEEQVHDAVATPLLRIVQSLRPLLTS